MTTAVTSAPQKTFLQNLTEQLDPATIPSDENCAALYDGAAKATAIFFSLAAVCGFVAAAVLLPHLIVNIAVGAAILLICTALAAHAFKTLSINREKLVEEKKWCLERQASLSTPELIQQSLGQKGIIWNRIPGVQRPEDLERLKPLIAMHDWIDFTRAKIENKMQKKLQEAQRLDRELADENQESGFFDIFHQFGTKNKIDDITNLRTKAAEYASHALDHKLAAAFINALLYRPDFSGDLKQIGYVFEGKEQSRDEPYRFDPREFQYFTFNNRRILPITLDQVKTLDIPRLGLLLSLAMV
jgi:hypothetical protein